MTLLKVVKVTYNDHRKVTGRLQDSKQLGCAVGFVRVKGFASVSCNYPKISHLYPIYK